MSSRDSPKQADLASCEDQALLLLSFIRHRRWLGNGRSRRGRCGRQVDQLP